MAWFEHAGHRIYYEESGAGEPLLLMPGWSLTMDDMAKVRDALTTAYRVIATDLPGCGKSQPQPRSYTPSFYHDDARLFLSMLRALDASPAHLVGFSDGGEYALIMGTMEPEAVRSIVTWGAAGTLPNAPELAELFGNVIDAPPPELKEFSTYLTTTYGDDNARAMTKSWTVALTQIMAAGGDLALSKAASATCPALLMTAEHDDVSPPALAQEMARAMPAAEFVLVEDAHHALHRERPEWLIDTITGWLARRA